MFSSSSQLHSRIAEFVFMFSDRLKASEKIQNRENFSISVSEVFSGFTFEGILLVHEMR